MILFMMFERGILFEWVSSDGGHLFSHLAYLADWVDFLTLAGALLVGRGIGGLARVLDVRLLGRFLTRTWRTPLFSSVINLE